MGPDDQSGQLDKNQTGNNTDASQNLTPKTEPEAVKSPETLPQVNSFTPTPPDDNSSPLHNTTTTPEVVISQKSSHGKSKKKWLLILIVILVVLVGAGSWWLISKNHKPAASNESGAGIRIGLSMATLTIARWPIEQNIMEKDAAAVGATVIAYNANNNTATQISQIEDLIAQKVNVIIVNANDASLLAPVIATASQAGIKVIAYDRLIDGTGTSEYISFNSTQTGVDWANYIVSATSNLKTVNVAFLDGSPTDNNATLLRNGVMSVLNPLIKSGKINLVFNQNTANWDPSIAYTTFQADVATGTRIDAVIAGNDELANSVIEVLQANGLAGKIPVTGQDGELGAIQRIEDGTQMLTVYKPGYDEADLAVKDAVALAKGQSVQSNTVTNNGTVNVPSYLFSPIMVTKANIESVIIKGGVYTSQQIFGTTPTTP
jgi:D-xylose transport system substrate-binding protein